MTYFIIVAVVVLVGFIWVKRLAGMVYDNEKYTRKLAQRFSYDKVLENEKEKEDNEEKQ